VLTATSLQVRRWTGRTLANIQTQRVLILGCGNIAGGFDSRSANNEYPQSHAGAYRRHGGFELACCVDPDANKREAFAKTWSVHTSVATIEQAASSGDRFDVIVICSPTAQHAADLATVLRLRPRLVVCEKPVTPTAAETSYWVEAYAAEGVPLLVNYTRRWAPDIVRVAYELSSGARGPLRCVIGIYNKGLMNNGSHLVDLLKMTCGDLSVVATGEPRTDYSAIDPSVPFMLRSAQGVPITVNIADASDFAVFEIQFVTAHGILSMEEGGWRWRERAVAESPIFPGYRVPGAGTTRDGEYRSAMLAMVANQYEFLERGEPLACTGRDALSTQLLCASIRESSINSHG
jgi:predicted dehydrogenase